MSFAAISDIHLNDNAACEWFLDLGLEDMSKAEDRLDAVLFDGDNTNLGGEDQYARLAKSITSLDFTDQTILTMGNHDSWCGTWDGDCRSPEQSISLFCQYNKTISGRDIDKPYYSTEINGYPAIILGSEGNHTDATISETQLEWFRAEMSKAAETGLPIFVFLHQPFNQTHGLPYNWEMEDEENPDEGGIGDMSDEILEVIQSYDNVFYISGHIHAGFSTEDDGNCYVSVEKYDGYTLINLPSYGNADFIHGGCSQLGTGYVVEVYDGKVMLRARNFTTGMWLSRYDQTIELV